MNFNAIVGNPPYQAADGGYKNSARSIYPNFIKLTKNLNTKYTSLIVPSRWMTGGKGLNGFRKEMINDRSIKVLHDYTIGQDCFDNVGIAAGICYFLRENTYIGKCTVYSHNDTIEKSFRYLVEKGDSIFIRENKLISIKNKVWSNSETKSFSSIVSSRKPYGICTDFFNDPSKWDLPELSDVKIENGYSILGRENNRRCWKYISNNYPIPNKNMLHDYKLFVPVIWSCDVFMKIKVRIVLAKPNELCTETFLQIGPCKSEEELYNLYTYFNTKFFKILMSIKKITPHSSRSVYEFVPLQDFTKPWTDEELYKKYDLNQDEIDYIEKTMK